MTYDIGCEVVGTEFCSFCVVLESVDCYDKIIVRTLFNKNQAV